MPKIVHVSDAFKSLVDVTNQRQQQRERGEVIENLFGIPALDEYLVPLWIGDICVIIALTSNGKSFLGRVAVSNYLLRVGRSGAPVIWVSTEETLEKVAALFIARMIDGISYLDIVQGRVPVDDFIRAASSPGLFRLMDLPLYIIAHSSNIEERDQGIRNLNINEIRASITSLGERPGLVVLDYLQRVRTTEDIGVSKQQQVSDIVEGLRAFTDEFKTTLMVMSQAKARVVERATPMPGIMDSEWSAVMGHSAELGIASWIPRTTHTHGANIRIGQHSFILDANQSLMAIQVAKQKDGDMGRVFIVEYDPINLTLRPMDIVPVERAISRRQLEETSEIPF